MLILNNCVFTNIPHEPKAQDWDCSKHFVSDNFFDSLLCMMSERRDAPNMVISGTQHWLWAQKPHPAVLYFHLQGAANQTKDGGKKIYYLSSLAEE